MDIDVSGAISAICVTILIILCAGQPDLLDAIIEYVRAAAVTCK